MWIWGNGGHAKVIKAALFRTYTEDEIKVIDYNDPSADVWEPSLLNREGLITIGDNKTRKRIANALPEEQKWALVFDKLGAYRQIGFRDQGDGSVFLAGCVVQPGCMIGDHVIINTCASVDHDCNIGDFVHIAPGAHLCGNVEVGDGAFIGAGTIVTPGSKIEPWAFIKAGSLVTPEGIVARI